MGCEAFPQLWQGLLLKMAGELLEQRATNERQIGQQVGVAGARMIFSHQCVASPVVADFDPAPVSADEFQPLSGLVFFGRSAGQIVTGLGGGVAGLFNRALAAQNDQGSGEGKVGGEWLDGEGVQVTDFDASVPGLGVGKKGVSGKASIPWACLSRLGWLPLTWSR